MGGDGGMVVVMMMGFGTCRFGNSGLATGLAEGWRHNNRGKERLVRSRTLKTPLSGGRVRNRASTHVPQQPV